MTEGIYDITPRLTPEREISELEAALAAEIDAALNNN